MVGSWSRAPHQIQMYPYRDTIGLLQLAITWYKIRHAVPHWDIKTKRPEPVKLDLSLYHVIVSCKRPIAQLLPACQIQQHVISA